MKIVLSNGYVIDNLELNGNNYISKVEIDESLFFGNCSPVVIHGENEVETHEHMVLVHLKKYHNEWWFALNDVPPDELKKIKLQANIEYIAMMANVDLEA